MWETKGKAGFVLKKSNLFKGEERNKNQSENDNIKKTNAFTMKVKGACWTCGRTNHKQAECYYNNQRERSSQQHQNKYRGRDKGRGRSYNRGEIGRASCRERV